MSVTLENRFHSRQHPRHALSGRVFIHNEEQIFIAPLNNLSKGGLFVDRLVSIEVGQRVKVVVKSPSLPSPIQATGTVVRVETQTRLGTAVQFDWIDPQGALQL